MIHILLVGTNIETIDRMTSLLKEHENVQSTHFESGADAHAQIRRERFDLVVADEVIDGDSGLEFIKTIVSVNPLMNCAAISGVPSEKFHEASEGLGLLMQLPLLPAQDQIEYLLSQLKKILSMTSTGRHDEQK